MIDKQKLIKEISLSIASKWQEKAYDWGHQVGDYIDSEELAEAAFSAMQDCMPEITLNLHEDLTLNEEKAKLWDKLKNLGK